MKAFWFALLVIVGAYVYVLHQRSSTHGQEPKPAGGYPEDVTYKPPVWAPHDATAGSVLGYLRKSGSTFSSMLPRFVPQLHLDRDGIPYTGLEPTIRINAPEQPQLELDPVTAVTWYLRAIPEERPNGSPHGIILYNRRDAYVGRSS